MTHSDTGDSFFTQLQAIQALIRKATQNTKKEFAVTRNNSYMAQDDTEKKSLLDAFERNTKKYNSVTKHSLIEVFVLSSCDTAILKNPMLYLKTKSLTSENAFRREKCLRGDMLWSLSS